MHMSRYLWSQHMIHFLALLLKAMITEHESNICVVQRFIYQTYIIEIGDIKRFFCTIKS